MAVAWIVQQNLVIAFSFIGFVLVSIPLCWHLEAWNIGCILYIFWTGSQCLIQFINAIVWKDNAINWAPVWCDITSRWMIASSVGITTASLLINRRLYHIANITTVHTTRDERRRMILIDLAIGLGVPILQVLLYWFIQGHRFDIIEGLGCIFVIPNTVPSWFIYYMSPILIGLVSAVYCSLTIRAFLKRRKQLNELMGSGSNLNFERYSRLMALAAVEICLTVPLGIYTLVYNITATPIYKWEGLANLHYDFSAVDQIPAVVWRSSTQVVNEVAFDQWSCIACALLFFGFFGFAQEARKHYSRAWIKFATRFGLPTDLHEHFKSKWFSGRKQPTLNGQVTIPTFLQQPRPDSLAAVSISISLGDVGSDGNVKDSYPPSTHSADSSTCVSHPDQKAMQLAEKRETPLPPLPPLVFPEPVLDINFRSLTAFERPLPDVPSSVTHSIIDMV